MKVLFAFNNESQVNQLIDFYKKTYGEKLEVTKVYFFRALIDTLKKNKNFDRIVIHEEVEPFGSKNQDAIDKYLFNNLDKASDEAGRADIIVVCTERRQPNDKFVKTLFNLGIYNVLTGQDRTFGKVSELINKPRTKKEAKMFVDADLEENPYEANDKIDELELRNIVKYYEKNIFSKEKIVSGFDSLYEQYTFEKLKQIIPFLPTKAIEVLEQESSKYIALMNYKPQKGGKGERVRVVEVPVYIQQDSVKKPNEPPIYKPEPVVEEKPKAVEIDRGPIIEEKSSAIDNITSTLAAPVAGVIEKFSEKANKEEKSEPIVEQLKPQEPEAPKFKVVSPVEDVSKGTEVKKTEPIVEKFSENIKYVSNVEEVKIQKPEPTVQKFEEIYSVPKIQAPVVEVSNKLAEEEAKRQAEEEARKQAEEAKRQAEELAKKQAEEEARIKAEEEARKRVEEEARRKAEEEAKRQAEEAKRKADELIRQQAEEAKRKAEELARQQEEEEKRKAEELAKQQEEEEKRKAEELARQQAEEEKRKAEELARQQAEEEKKKAEELARQQAEEEAKRKAEELAKQQAEEAKRKAEELARQQAEEEAKRKAEELAKQQAEEEAKKRGVVITPTAEPEIIRPEPIKPSYTPPVQQPSYTPQPRYQPPRPMPDEPRIQTVTQVIEKEVITPVYDTPRDYKKAVCFVGAHKTGTTFLINAIANGLVSKGIKVAILDLTYNKDSYVIYTNRDLDQKDIAANSLNNLAIGQDRPFRLGNLSIYTGIPRTNKNKLDIYKAIEIAKRENSVVLIDCDFTTKKDVPDVFRYAQSIYVVQDMDTLNILPITMFLKELKSADVDPMKISVIINKYMKSSLKVDDILGSLAVYTTPDFSVMEEELLPRGVKRFIVPFDEQNYLRYIENVSASKMNFSGFSEDFKQAISIIIQDVFPIGSRPAPRQVEEGGFLKGLFGRK